MCCCGREEGARNDALKQVLLDDYHKRLRILEEFLEEQKKLGVIRDDVDIQQLALAISALFNGLIIGKIFGIYQELIEQTLMGAFNIMYSSPLQGCHKMRKK